jgi:hypothetical protein
MGKPQGFPMLAVAPRLWAQAEFLAYALNFSPTLAGEYIISRACCQEANFSEGELQASSGLGCCER